MPRQTIFLQRCHGNPKENLSVVIVPYLAGTAAADFFALAARTPPGDLRFLLRNDEFEFLLFFFLLLRLLTLYGLQHDLG